MNMYDLWPECQKFQIQLQYFQIVLFLGLSVDAYNFALRRKLSNNKLIDEVVDDEQPHLFCLHLFVDDVYEHRLYAARLHSPNYMCNSHFSNDNLNVNDNENDNLNVNLNDNENDNLNVNENCYYIS